MFSNTMPVDHTSLGSDFSFSLLKLQIVTSVRHKCIVLVAVNFSEVLDLLCLLSLPLNHCEYPLHWDISLALSIQFIDFGKLYGHTSQLGLHCLGTFKM